MRVNYRYLAMLLMAGMFSIAALAQNITITGTVTSGTNNENVSAVSVLIKGTGVGTYTNERGQFRITTSQRPPLTLVFSSVGFSTKDVTVTSSTGDVAVSLEPSVMQAEGVVVAATRTPERVLEAPVTVERVSTATIRNAAAPNYYDILTNLKGVDVTTSSFNFKTISTRGFNGSGNLRFNQLVDGMDNQAPGLNFSVGSIIGLTELDVESMELLPGASSALYGPGGMNGTLLINSKNPFRYQGLSWQVKQGVNHIDNAQRGAAPFFDWSLRWGKKVSEKFAFKIGGQFIQAQDWQARDMRNLNRNNVFSSIKEGDRMSDPNYDGVNVFGDEASASMQAFAQLARLTVQAQGGTPALTALDAQIAAGMTPQQIAGAWMANPGLAPLASALPFLIPTSSVANNPYRTTFGNQLVSRTGYEERHLVDYNSYNVRLSGGLYYKITPSVEASLLAHFGTGTTVYTGADRYSLRNLKMGQYKLEVKGSNWFVRGYTTQENSGDSYTATTAAVAINNSWKGNQQWFQEYAGTYSAARLGLLPGVPTMLPNANAHSVARARAETGRLAPGTEAFQNAFNNAVNTPISKGGAQFDDRTNLYHAEGQVNLSQYVQFVEVLVGANVRRYELNSNGTIFADTTGKIGINEYGGYIQAQKNLLKDRVRLTGSIRYDKNQNFEGRFTPRLTALFKVAQNNNIRVSYQTAYRFPSTQDQYINLQTPAARLIGGLPQFNTYFNFEGRPAYTAESIVNFRNSGNPNDLKAATFTGVKPERVQSIEVGYKSLIAKKLFVDVYGYHSRYEDFIARVAVGRGENPLLGAVGSVVNPLTTTNYSFVTNSSTPIKAIGYGIGVEYSFYKNFLASGNFYSDQLQDVPAGLVTFFNTPKYRANLGVSNSDVYKGWGFNVIYRWQDKINWEGTFGSGEVPAYKTVDAMISYKFTNIRSIGKIGATNLFNKYYRSAFGNPQIGGLYYISFGYNIF
ncbi:TonB-dependent receptor [Aridibaculum aurantiacum]|uniref:TonB-dependent receptor n=1 Tax=Aridibaculum aurantiacum TaxID=2810307 RepID=UPI001A96515C|nr:TonB-dependent receptor [Aridibaculum aurantiacum]